MGVRDSLLSVICQAEYDAGSLDPFICPCMIVGQSLMQARWLPMCSEHGGWTRFKPISVHQGRSGCIDGAPARLTNAYETLQTHHC
jgi:hypothetical protein